MRSDNACLIIALGVKMLSWFDLLLSTNDTHIHRDYWHKGKSLKHGYRRCTAAAVLLMCCCCIVVSWLQS